MKTMTRRKFLKAGFGLAAVASGLEMITGCATTEAPKVVTISYPMLPYNKIQPPKEGCFIGIYTTKLYRVKEPSLIEQTVDYYREAFGSKPSTFIMMIRLEAGFSTIQATRLVKEALLTF